MRKFMIVLTLAVSFFAVGGAVIAGDIPPGCDPCPWVR
jgi:hypothetical protein